MTTRTRLLLVLGVSAVAFALGQTLVIPAIPNVRRDLGASADGAAWLVTAYFLRRRSPRRWRAAGPFHGVDKVN